MRLYDVTREEVRAILASPIETSQDATGKPIFDGVVGGRRIAVVIAADDPEVVVTVFERRG
jgi:hypothetical protein